MPSRPIWHGHLRLALVSCPVALYSARHDRNSIRFNMINPATGNRIRMISQDAETGEEIRRSETVKGYEFQKNRYVLFEDGDFDSVKVESSTLMTVEKFVDEDSIDPIYYDASYYLAPDGKGSDDVYAVLRETISRTGKVALTRVVISQRARTIAIRPIDGGLVAHTLNEERDLNSSSELFENTQHIKVDEEMVQLAVQFVQRQSGRYDPADLEDRYETRLQAMINAKLKGAAIEEEAALVGAPSNVIDLMAALKKSLGAPPETAAEPVKAAKPARKTKTKPVGEEVRRQQAFKLPIEGGKRKAAKGGEVVALPEPAAKSRRKAG
jgi:DNA end-binding protein Ku